MTTSTTFGPLIARDVERPVAEQPPVRRGLGAPVASLPLSAVQRQVPALHDADLTGRAESQWRPVPGGETTVDIPRVSPDAPMSLRPISAGQRPIQAVREPASLQGEVTPVQPSVPDPWATPEPTSSSDDPVERPVPVEPLHPTPEPGFDVAPRPVVSVQREPTMSAVPDATFRPPDERAARLPQRDGAPFAGQRAPEPAVVQRNGAQVVGQGEHPVVPVQRQNLPSISGPANTTAVVTSPVERIGSLDNASPVDRLDMPVVAAPQPAVDAQQPVATAEYAPEPDQAWTVQRSSAPAPTTAAGEVPGIPEQPDQEPQGAGASAPAAATAAGASPPGSQASSPAAMEELALRLFDPLLVRLRADLLVERERRGLRTDTW
ncbi:MAG: hypothetical protein WCG47_02655 [Dermatophilaceae bacterium]